MKIPKASSVYLVLLTTLFFPAKYIGLHTIVICLSLFFVMFSYGFSLPKKNSIMLFVLFLLFVTISSYIGIFYYNTDPIKNITEVIRFAPVLLIITSLKSSIPLLKHLTNVLLFYSIAVLIVSFSQVFFPNLVSGITTLYNSPKHIEISLGSSSRALGLSTGPGQNGLIMAIIFSFAISQIIGNGRKLKPTVLAVVSFICVILSQSQTSFILVVISFIYGLLFSIFYLKKEYRKIGLRYLTIFTPLAIVGIYYFQNNLKYLFSLFAYGLGRSSYTARIDNTSEIYNSMLDHPMPILLGHGKGFFGDRAGHMDNEYIFYLAVYGLSASSIILLFYTYIILIPYIRNKSYTIKNEYLLPLHLIVIAGVVGAWPATFILDLRILIIVSILYIMHIRTNQI